MGEIRTKGRRSEAYRGLPIDSYLRGPPPGLWDMAVGPGIHQFGDSEKVLDVPHTDIVTACNECRGKGYVMCRECSAFGAVFCEVCKNDGPRMFQGERCIYCRRWGNEGFLACCESCRGCRELKCTICDGRGSMKHCDTLIVTRLAKLDEIASHKCAVPFRKLSEVKGVTVLEEMAEKLQPLMCPQMPSFHQKSKRLLCEHQGAFPNIVKQRHSLRTVPVNRVSYTWKGRTGEFHLYGTENKVHFGDHGYLGKWTSSCTLM